MDDRENKEFNQNNSELDNKNEITSNYTNINSETSIDAENIDKSEIDKLNEEEIKRMNMQFAELRQRSIEKFGRDIYTDGITTEGLKKMRRINEKVEKGIKVFLILGIVFFIFFIAFALFLGWGTIYFKYKDYIHFE